MKRAEFLRCTATVVMGISALDGDTVQRAFVEVVSFDDSATHITLHHSVLTADRVLRDYYLPAIREHLNQHSLFLDGYRV